MNRYLTCFPIRLLALLCAAAGLANAQPNQPSMELPIVGLAHVAFQSSDLPASRMHYTGMLGLELAFAVKEPSEAWYFKINDDQFVKLVAKGGPTDDNRLVEIAFQVSDVDRAHSQLRERGLEPTAVAERADGTRATTLRDPDGHLLAFVEYVPGSLQAGDRGRHLGARRASDRLWHTGVSVADEAKAVAFYEGKLGFKEFWRGAPEGLPTHWVNVRMPGERGDYLEYMLLQGPPTRERLGSMHHVCLQTHDLRGAHQALCNHGLQDIERYHPRLGRNRHWLFNVFDPDGTRTEYMHAHSIDENPYHSGEEPFFLGASKGGLTEAKRRLAAGDPASQASLDKLIERADKAITKEPPSVTRKTRPGASGDLRDYYSQAPYLWPDPNQPDGLPYIPRDGVVNPDSRNPDFSDRGRLSEFGDDVDALALAYYFTGNEAYAQQAARFLKVWFLDPETRMNPNMNYAQAVPGRNTGRGIGIIDGSGLTDAIDAAALLDGSPAWSKSDAEGLGDWASEFLEWMLVSENGREEAAMRQNHGTMYDVKLVVLAAHSGRFGLAREVLESVKRNRIALQIEPDGSQPMELRRTKSYNYSTMNLRGMVALASFGERLGVDLWRYQTPDGRGIRRAIEFLLPYLPTGTAKWPYEQITPFDWSRPIPTLRMAANAYDDPVYAKVAAALPGAEGSRDLLLHPSIK